MSEVDDPTPTTVTSGPLFGSFRLTSAAKKATDRIMRIGRNERPAGRGARADDTDHHPPPPPHHHHHHHHQHLPHGAGAASPYPNPHTHPRHTGAATDSVGSPMSPHSGADARERVQRHNDIEKKRRESMNEHISELHTLVPALHTVHRPSKSTILSKTIEYLRRLQNKAARLEVSMTETQNELARLRKYNQLLLQLLTEHGVLPPAAATELQPREQPINPASVFGPSAAAAAAATMIAPPPVPSPHYQYQQHGYHQPQQSQSAAAATASTVPSTTNLASAGRATGYFAQDGGRVMLLVTALLFFAFAPWGVGPGAAGLAGVAPHAAPGRQLLVEDPAHLAAATTAGGSWLAIAFWVVVRWIVMTSLLTLAMYWDSVYCSPAILDSLAKVRELNRLAEEAMSNGNYMKAQAHTHEALVLLRRPVPTSAFDLFVGNLYQGARQLAHRCVVGLVIERFLLFSLGQAAYCAELERAYLNLSQQNHCLPNYDKWHDLYVILCAVNFAEIAEGDRGQGLVQAYGALCYHVVVHSRLFEIFASIYFSRAFDVINRMGLHRSQFGQFYIVVAYRNLTKGRFQEAFDNLQKGMEMHKVFGLLHHYRECVLMKGWIEHAQGRQRESSETFLALYNSASADMDHYSQRWAMLGMVANFQQVGQYETAAQWLASIKALDEDLRTVNNHQEIFLLGFTALQHLRQGLEDGALAVADRTFERMAETTRSGMPHNVLPMLHVLEVHLTLLESILRGSGVDKAALIERLVKSVQKDLGLMQQFTAFFPVMQSSGLIFEGRFHYLVHGSEEKALDLFRRAVESARSYNMRMQEAWAHFEIGRLLPAVHPQRLSHLEAALKVFVEFDAAYEERLTLNEMQTRCASRLFVLPPKVLV